MKTIQYLNACKAKLNVTSDYALAKRLNVPSSLMSKYVNGQSVPGPLTAFKIAEILGDQPAAVIADFEAERAEKMGKEDDAEAWRGILKKLGGAAASILLVVAGGGFGNADAKLAQQQADSGNTHRIKRRQRQASPWSALLAGNQAFA